MLKKKIFKKFTSPFEPASPFPKTTLAETKQTRSSAHSLFFAQTPDTSFVLSFKLAKVPVLWVTPHNAGAPGDPKGGKINKFLKNPTTDLLHEQMTN